MPVAGCPGPPDTGCCGNPDWCSPRTWHYTSVRPVAVRVTPLDEAGQVTGEPSVLKHAWVETWTARPRNTTPPSVAEVAGPHAPETPESHDA